MFDIVTEKERIHRHNIKSRKSNCKADLTIEQWTQTLEYFNHACAYCGGTYEIIEHYIPVSRGGGTTASNCVPACDRCNNVKDNRGNQSMRIYNNRRVIDYLTSLGARIRVHVHELDYRKKREGVLEIFCGCGYKYLVKCTPIEALTYTEGDAGRLGVVSLF